MRRVAAVRVEFANTLRGLAAVSVLFSHYVSVFWNAPAAVAVLVNAPVATFAPPAGLRMLQTEPHFSFGPFGVALFFLISGFVIPFSLRKAGSSAFLRGRVFRILPTYAAGFTICLIAVYLSGRYFGRAWPFPPRQVVWHYLPGLHDLANVVSMDGVIWTLDVEVKFYLVCAAAAVWFRRGSLWVFAVPVVVFCAVMAASRFGVAENLIFSCRYLPFMFVGTVFYFLHQGAIGLKIGAVLAGVLLAMFAALMRPISGPMLEYVAALALFSLAYGMPGLFRGNRVVNFMADISYPLYLIHGVAGYTGLRLLLDVGLPGWVALPAVTCGVIGLAWALHVLIERPAQILIKREWRFGFPLKGVAVT